MPKTAAETRTTRAFYLKTESKSQIAYFPGAEVGSEQISLSHGHGAGTKGWAGFGAGFIDDPWFPSLYSFLKQ